MKKRFVLIILISGVLLGLLIWFGIRQRKSRSIIAVSPVTETSLKAKSGTFSTQVSRSPIKKASTLPSNIVEPTNFQMTEEIRQKYREALDATKWEWRMPIDFYGKVLDAQGEPIAGAKIRFMWNDLSATGTSESQTVSDGNGFFSLTGVSGKGLSVYVNKAGYYVVKRTTSFDYSSGYHADPGHPEIFYLRKQGSGAELVTSQHGVFPDLEFDMPHDGSPVRVDFFNQKIGNEGQLELSAIKPDRRQRASEWSFRMSIPDGGFIECHDEFPFEAPESGYDPIMEFQFKAGQTNWSTRLKRQYYVAFGQPRKFGRITIETGMHRGVYLGYAINPTGSRNLEPK